MFHEIPEPILSRMAYLEEIDRRERIEGVPRMERLRQIPPSTGRFIALQAAMAPEGTYIEIGTSAGYSTLWIALACRETGRSVITYEHDAKKVAIAEETFRLAGVNDVVTLVHDDALHHLAFLDGVSFCFLDAEKEIYDSCYEAVIPVMTPGGIFTADNAIDFESVVRPMLERAGSDQRVDALVLPLDRGVLLARKRSNY